MRGRVGDGDDDGNDDDDVDDDDDDGDDSGDDEAREVIPASSFLSQRFTAS